MPYFLLVLILINTNISLTTFFKRKFEETLFLTVFAYIFIIYLMGVLFNNINIGFYLIIGVNLGLLIYNIYSIKKKKVLFKKQIFTLGFCVFILAYFLILIFCIGRKCISWDEFSHWLLVVRNMNKLGNFGLGNDSTIMIKNYLSGTSLFQYFCTRFSPEFNEGMCFIGINIMIIATIIPAFNGIRKKNWFVSTLLFFSLFFIMMIFYYDMYTSLYVDGILALTFAYVLYSYFSNAEEGLSLFNLINLSSGICMLIFIKDFGILFACGAFLVVLIDNIFIRNKFKIKKIWANSKFIILTAIPAVFVKISWIIMLKVFNVQGANTSTIIPTFANLIKGNLLEYQKNTIQVYMDALLTKSLSNTISLNISFSFCICIAIILGYIIISNCKKQEKSLKMFLGLTISGALLYSAILLIVPYLSLFSEYEAINLASYSRYMNSYILGLIFAELCVIIYLLKDNYKKLGNFTIILFFIVVLNLNHVYMFNMTIGARKQVEYTKETRKEFDCFVSLIKKHVQSNNRVYFIATNTKGYEYYVCRYELTPAKANKDDFGWSIGTPYYDGDIWTRNITVIDWKKDLINNYDYVYLYSVDDQFREIYGALFNNSNIDNNQLYKIEKTEGKEKILTLVEEEEVL